MSINRYLAALDVRLRAMGGLITSTSIQRNIDPNLGIGFIQGWIAFSEGSILEFSEQLPTQRQKYRLHYMDAQNKLIVRWDSAPHHRDLTTFPFHKHTPQGVEAHGAITLMEVLDEIARMLPM